MGHEGNPESYNALLKKAEQLTGRPAGIAGVLLKNKKLFCSENRGRLYTLVRFYDATEVIEAFGWDDFLQSLGKKEDVKTAVTALIGGKNTELLDAIWQRITDYPYMRGSYRRSIRTKRYEYLYYKKCVQLLWVLIADISSGFSIESYLESCRKPTREEGVFMGEFYTVPHLIAAIIDRGGAEAENLLTSLREIVMDDAGRATVTREIIEGLLKSSNSEAIQLVCDLLKAARLQEGLRQAIFESVDEGSLPAFAAILKLAADENLIRFSSVVRAFFTWMGIYIDVNKIKRTHLLFESAYRCVTDKEAIKECLVDEDGLKNVIALWALSLYGIEYAEEHIRDILKNGKRHQKLAALLFSSQIQFETLQYLLVRDILDHPEDSQDREIMAWVLESFNCKSIGTIPPDGNPLFYMNAVSSICMNKEEQVGLYLALKKHADSFDVKSKKGFTFENSVIEGFTVSYRQDMLLDRMVEVLYRRLPDDVKIVNKTSNEWGIPITVRLYREPVQLAVDEFDNAGVGGSSLRDDLCSYADKMPVDIRSKLLSNVVLGGTTPIQRALLIASLGDRSKDNVLQAWKYMMNSPFSEDEILTIEGFLRLKDGVIRQHILLKLLRQTPET